jgi:hypothetical protein
VTQIAYGYTFVLLLCLFFRRRLLRLLLNSLVKLLLLVVHVILRVAIAGFWKELVVEITNQFLKMFTLLSRFFGEEIYASVIEVPKIMFGSLLTEFPFSRENEVNLTKGENE